MFSFLLIIIYYLIVERYDEVAKHLVNLFDVVGECMRLLKWGIKKEIKETSKKIIKIINDIILSFQKVTIKQRTLKHCSGVQA